MVDILNKAFNPSDQTIGEQIVGVGGVKWWDLKVKKDFDADTLAEIDAAAEFTYEWVEPVNGSKPGLILISSNSATFEADAKAHIKVTEVYPSLYLPCGGDSEKEEQSGIASAGWDPSITPYWDPIPLVADFEGAGKVKLAHKVAGAHTRGVYGQNVDYTHADYGVLAKMVYRGAVVEASGKYPGFWYTFVQVPEQATAGETLNILIDGAQAIPVTFPTQNNEQQDQAIDTPTAGIDDLSGTLTIPTGARKLNTRSVKVRKNGNGTYGNGELIAQSEPYDGSYGEFNIDNAEYQFRDKIIGVGAYDNYEMGVINYHTGEITVSEHLIKLAVRENLGEGSSAPNDTFSKTLTVPGGTEIYPGSVRIYAAPDESNSPGSGRFIAADDGAGNFSSGGITGTINYITGALSITETANVIGKINWSSENEFAYADFRVHKEENILDVGDTIDVDSKWDMLEQQAYLIDQELGAYGFATVIRQDDNAGYDNGGYSDYQAMKWIIIGSNNPNSTAAQVKIVSGTGTILSKLGFRDGQIGGWEASVGNRDHALGSSRFTSLRIKYMKFVHHPAIKEDTLKINEAYVQEWNVSTSGRYQTGAVYNENYSWGGWRNRGATSAVKADRLFELDGNADAYGSWRSMAFCSVDVGDELVLQTGADAGSYIITEVQRPSPTVSNVFNIVKVDRDWPTGGISNVLFYVKPQSKLLNIADWAGHGMKSHGMINDRNFGEAPDATLYPTVNPGASIAGLQESMERAVYLHNRGKLDVYFTAFHTWWYPGVNPSESSVGLYFDALKVLQKSGVLSFFASGHGSYPSTTVDLKTWIPEKPASAIPDSSMCGGSCGPDPYEFSDYETAGFHRFLPWGGYAKGWMDFSGFIGLFSDWVGGERPISREYTTLVVTSQYQRMWTIFEEDEASYGWLDVGADCLGFTSAGTSFAPTAVGGVAILTLSALRQGRAADGLKKSSDEGQVRGILIGNCIDEGGDPLDTKGRDAYFGHGIPDANACVSKAINLP